MAKRGRPKKEPAEAIEIDPLLQCERILAEKKSAYAEAIRHLNQSLDDAALATAVGAFRAYYDFGCRLATVTGKNLYRPRWSDLNGALNEKQQRMLVGLKHSGGLPLGIAVGQEEIDALARLAEVTPAKPGPRIFEGENEYQKYLADRGLEEDDGDDYESRTGVAKRAPSNDPNQERYRFNWQG